MAKSLDGMVEAFRNRSLGAGPYTYVSVDALVQRVREDGQVQNVAVVLATGVNAEGRRKMLGVDLITAEDRAGWAVPAGPGGPGGSPACTWSSPTPRRASRPPSPPSSTAPPGSGVARTPCATVSPRCPARPSRWWPPWCAPCSHNPTPPPRGP